MPSRSDRVRSEDQVLTHPTAKLGIVEQQRKETRFELLAQLCDPREQLRLASFLHAEGAQLLALVAARGWRGIRRVWRCELGPHRRGEPLAERTYRRGASRLRQLIGLSSTHSSYDAMVTSKWSKNPVSPSSPKEGIHGSQNQTGAVQP